MMPDAHFGLALACPELQKQERSGELFEDGESGLLFRSGDAQHLAVRIYYLFQNMEKTTRFRKTAREAIVNSYRWSLTVKGIWESVNPKSQQIQKLKEIPVLHA
jgi:glycosyltransferase involved in cell wall biosynthesis